MLEIHDPCSILPARPHRLVQSPTLTLVQTQDQIQIRLLGPHPIHHPDPRVHAQGLALVHQTVKGDVGGAFRRQIVAIADVEGRIGENVTRVKIHPTTAGGDGNHHAVRSSKVDKVLFT